MKGVSMSGYDAFCRWKVIPATGGGYWEVRDTQSGRVFTTMDHGAAIALAEYLEETLLEGEEDICAECIERWNS
jgi:hypothetical protein